MARTRHFKTVYKNELIKVAGNMPTYTISWPDGRSVVIARFAEGWYMPGDAGNELTAGDIADLGHLIEQIKMPVK